MNLIALGTIIKIYCLENIPLWAYSNLHILLLQTLEKKNAVDKISVLVDL